MTYEPIIGDPAPVGVTPWPWRISNEWEYEGQVYCSILDSCYQGEVVGPSVRIEDARAILRAMEREQQETR